MISNGLGGFFSDLHCLLVLFRYWRKMDYRQLDEFVCAALRVRSHLPLVKSGEAARSGRKWHGFLDEMLVQASDRAIKLTLMQSRWVKPHEKASAFIIKAEVIYLAGYSFDKVRFFIEEAAALEPEIVRQEDRAEALQALVGILSKAGELYSKGKYPSRSEIYLSRARFLSQGDAGMPVEGPNIDDLLLRAVTDREVMGARK